MTLAKSGQNHMINWTEDCLATLKSQLPDGFTVGENTRVDCVVIPVFHDKAVYHFVISGHELRKGGDMSGLIKSRASNVMATFRKNGHKWDTALKEAGLQSRLKKS